MSTRRQPIDPAERDRLNAKCEEIADALGIDPEDVLHDGTHVCLSVGQVDRLLAMLALDGPR